MKRLKEKRALLKLVWVAAFVAVDLLTKRIFQNVFQSRSASIPVIDGLLEFVYVDNTGASMGIFANHTSQLAIISAAFILLICLYDFFNSETNKYYIASFVCLLGGAIGNLVDRLFLGYVRDFIGVFNWFVCNVADIFVTLGVVFYIVFIFLELTGKEKHGN